MTPFEEIAAIIDGAVEPVAPAIPEPTSARKRRKKPDDPPATAAPASPSPPSGGGNATSAAQTLTEPGEQTSDGVEVRGPDIVDGKEDWTGAILDCIDFDNSDTDNGKRLIRYFGHDLRVLAHDGLPDGEWLGWTGTHWDYAGGAARALKIAQRIGELIRAEADFMSATKSELAAIEEAKQAAEDLQAMVDRNEYDATDPTCMQLLAIVRRGEAARAALNSRKAERRKNAVGAKNIGKLKAMLACAGPHLRTPPDAFNADHYLIATATHTLRLELDPEAPDPAVKRWKLTATPGHRREDLITAIVPWPYDPAAAAPRWIKQLEYFLPDEKVRRTVQQFTGFGTTGAPIQRILYHRGYTAANGKSTFLETIVRVMGDAFAIGLPQESIVGNSQASPGQASPDLVRLFGKRTVRVLELPEGAALRQEVIKKLTGGEKFPVRALFKGFFEFQPQCKAHMAGNGDPRFDGSDEGMKRRLVVIPWDVKIPESEQRDFEEVVGELVAEAPGILNWLIEGALDFLNSGGLVLSDKVRATMTTYFDEMDPVGSFAKAHIEIKPGEDVQARVMYEAFKRWCEISAKRVRSETYFGSTMRKKGFVKDDTGARVLYKNLRLINVPDPAATANPAAESGSDEEIVT